MADGDREVLSSLPRTRPERRSAKRGARTPAKPKTTGTQPRTPPKATREAAPKAVPPGDIPAAGYAVPKTSSPVSAGGAELIGTAIQAVGELASLGTRALRGALGRIPKA
jgi:hypothetical protein